MLKVRIWALESNHDAETVKCLAHKLVTYHKLEGVSIQSSGKSAIPKPRGNDSSSSDRLKKAVQNYLREDACVIFVIDSDSPMSRHQRRLESNSLINHVYKVLGDRRLKGRVFLTQAVHELESWLLVDCLGIFCHFANQRRQFRNECREKVSQDKTLMRIVRKNQKGDTQQIVEAEIGGKGPKEYLVRFSEDILLGLNSNMRQRNVRAKRYKENMAPAIAKHVVINRSTLSCNSSLQELGNLLGKIK